MPAQKVLSALMRDRIKTGLLVVALLGVIVGVILRLAGWPAASNAAWAVAATPALVALIAEIARSLWRKEAGLDLVAALSIAAALTFGENLAAAVVAVMYSSGSFLESYAEGRARREMHNLLARAPRTATRYRDGGLEETPLDDIAPGDRLLIRQGDVAPVDGAIASENAFLDTSALTGESLPRKLAIGAEAMSGSINAGDAIDIIALRRAQDSAFAGIVRLVEQAQRSKAPMSRLADRWSLAFFAATVTLAFAAWWFSADPIRAVAVLVVATPCPLILAVPVALVAGLSRAAAFGVLIKGAKPLEAMARIKTLILDKTGTLTEGRPRILSIENQEGMAEPEVLRLAAAVDQASKHPVAQAIVAAATERGLPLSAPSGVTEIPGEGVVGTVEGRVVIVGGDRFVATRIGRAATGRRAGMAGSVVVSVAVDGQLAGRLIMADPLREGVRDVLAGLRREGVERIVLATGDRIDVARRVTEGLGLDALRAELSPHQKVSVVLTERKSGSVMMVGDGVNDAPALSAADVGVAMGARGAAASADAADVVLLVDRIDRLGFAIEIARQSRSIALESVFAGIGLSLIGMVAAAFGYLTPVQGALLQEAIDFAVVLNALRALNIEPRELDAS